MQALVYARVSQDEQDTLTEQIDAGRERVRREGGTVVAIESDKLSGFDARRPGYQALLKAARSRDIDTVVVWKLDRLGRDHAEAIRAAQELDRLGIRLVSVTEAIDDPFYRDLMFVFAGQASRQTAERVRLKMVSNAKAGLWNGRPPVGYLMGLAIDPINGKGHRLVLDPAKAPLVTRLFELAATGKYSLNQLRIEAERMGLRFAGERPISRTRVGTILRNPAYVGDVVYGRTPHGRFQARHHADESEWAVHQDAHPAITDRETFRLVQETLRRNKAPGFQAGVRGSQYFLTGLVVCGDCGSRMYGGAGGNGRGKYRFTQYSCVRGSEYGNCTVKSVGGKGVDDYVKTTLASIKIGTSEKNRAVELLRQRELARHDETEQQRANLLRDRQRHQNRRLELARRRFDTEIPAELYAQLEDEEQSAIGIIDGVLRGLEESKTLDVSAELAWLDSRSLDQSDFDLEAWQEFARLFIQQVVVRRPEGQRSTRWRLNLDISIVWKPAGELLRQAAEALP